MTEDIKKRTLCNWLIKNNLVVPYQIIRHSYSEHRMNNWGGERYEVC